VLVTALTGQWQSARGRIARGTKNKPLALCGN